MSVTEAKQKDTKKPTKYERLGVLSQVVRVHAQVKDLLNAQVQQDSLKFRNSNETIFTEISQLNKDIRTAVTEKDKETARNALKEYKESKAVKSIIDKLKEVREPLYRVNKHANDKFLFITHQLISDLIDHAVSVDIPKIYKASFNHVTHPSLKDLPSFPLLVKIIQRINSRPVSPEEKPPPKVKKVKKTADDTVDETQPKTRKKVDKKEDGSEEPRTKRKGYYQSAITHALKKRSVQTTDGKKIMLPAETGQFLAEVVSEFVNDVVFYVKHLVDITKVKTVTGSQIDLALRFMFFNEDHFLEKYDCFMKKIDSFEHHHPQDAVSCVTSERTDKPKKKNSVNEKLENKRRARVKKDEGSV